MASIDPSEFVQVEGDQLSLKFGDPRQQAKFELGVCMAIYKWEELATAVENSWGGPKSPEKRDWISAIVIDLFEEKAVDLVLIEQTLLYAMVDEFDTEIDNDSALEIADLVMKVYKECAMQIYSRVDDMYAKYQAKQAVRAPKEIVVVGADPNNPDDSDDDYDEENFNEDSTNVQSGTNDSEDVEMEIDVHQEPNGPIVDEDGFELVQKKGRRR